MRYPDEPGFKPGAIETSREAAEAMKPKDKAIRENVLDLYRWKSAIGIHLTADEAAHFLGRSVLSVRPRVSQLVKLGKLKDTGIRRRNISGHKAAALEYVFGGSNHDTAE